MSKRYALMRMRVDGGTKNAVVVFSMGKTGSTALARAIRDATGSRVFQVFRLAPERLAQAEERYRSTPRNGSASQSSPFPGAMHLWESAFLLGHPPSDAAPWRVVTPVREPIAQAVSAFFHATLRRGVPREPVDRLVARLVDEGWIATALRWFDREFAPALGIDVYDHPFDPAQGHGELAASGARVFLVRLENLEAAGPALGRFLGVHAGLAIEARNEGSTREYAGAYAQFLAEARVPVSVLDDAYASRYARHFYAPAEIEGFRHRWRHRP